MSLSVLSVLKGISALTLISLSAAGSLRGVGLSANSRYLQDASSTTEFPISPPPANTTVTPNNSFLDSSILIPAVSVPVSVVAVVTVMAAVAICTQKPNASQQDATPADKPTITSPIVPSNDTPTVPGDDTAGASASSNTPITGPGPGLKDPPPDEFDDDSTQSPSFKASIIAMEAAANKQKR